MTPVSIDIFQADVELLYAAPMRKIATLRQVQQVFREFRAVPGVETTADLNPRAIGLWIKAHPERSATTIESLLRCLSAISSYAVHRGWMDCNPLGYRPPSQWVRRDVRPVRRPRPGSRTPEEIGAVLERADLEAVRGRRQRRLRALAYTYAFLGLRREEALHLHVSDLDMAARRVTLRAHPEDDWTPKTLASEAVLPIAPRLWGVLGGWMLEVDTPWLFAAADGSGPWMYGPTPLAAIKALGERAGVANLSIANFRKTVGTWAKTWGMGQLELKALLRHANVETQEWYDDGPAEALRPAAERVDYPRRRSA